MRQVYLAATGQNRGKTTTSIGLLDGFLRRGLDTRFMKPVGQRTIIEDGVPADEDAVLVRNVFGLTDPMTVMSPVHIPRGFTKALSLIHISEPTRLGMISYAVFCLKKKKK